MGINTNVDAGTLLNANVANTTRNSNLSPGGPVIPPTLLQEGPEVELAGDAATFEPGDHTVAEVKAYVTAHPEIRDDFLAAELAGKNRSTLVDWLAA